MTNSNLVDVSSSLSTRVTTAEASGALFDGTGAVTFATVDTGQGANELYDMDQNVKTDSAVTFSTVNTGQGANELYDMDQNVKTDSNVQFADITSTGTITAQQIQTEFVSASITLATGSNIFGDNISDSHQFTGSILQSGSFTTRGNVTGSATSTGSFGRVLIGEMGNTDLTVVSSSVSTRATTLENANISGGFIAQTVLSGSGTLISGSATSTGSFGYLHIGGNITASGVIKADAFESVTGGTTIDFGDSLDITGDITASGNFTGSAISTETGSFGRVESSLITGTLVTAAQTNITSVGTIDTGVWDSSFGSTANTTISGSFTDASSSFSTRVTTEEGNVDALQTDSGSFSTRVALLEGLSLIHI